MVQSHSIFTELDIHLFRQGKHFELYDKLGSRVLTKDKENGVYFAVWAPNAVRVSVTGTFNQWDVNSDQLYIRTDGSGIWEGFISNAKKGDLYKYSILASNGMMMEKTDPFALFCEQAPQTASIIWDTDYKWKDDKWMGKRAANAKDAKPYSVYEVHLGSWKKKKKWGDSFSYRELVDELVPYVKEMGFTHVEFLPLTEHPYYPSWGYQTTGYFAPTSRYGTPQDFMFLVDAFHKAGIGVLMDWVPSHFPSDGHGLAYFDGTHLFEHADPKKGYHPDWKSYIFNLSRFEVKSFLISSALFWMRKYHIDGFRVDAVASMLYLDYSRNEGEWIPNEYGGRENLEAISFLKEFNQTIYDAYPGAVTIAEESTAWPKVSGDIEDGGLGFGQKWMMGWMHDTLKYFEEDPINRKFHQGQLTFSIIYAWSERFMLPLSHDEVVHGKASLIYKMPGTDAEKFANLRLLYGYMFTHPGTKLLFMGGEFAQTQEWSEERGLDWELLQYDDHQGMQFLVKDLNKLYTSHPALYELQFSEEGFDWIDFQDYDRSVLIFQRKASSTKKTLIIVLNLTPVQRNDYVIGVPDSGTWKIAFNTDKKRYGGNGIPLRSKRAVKKNMHNLPYQIKTTLPPLSMVAFEK